MIWFCYFCKKIVFCSRRGQWGPCYSGNLYIYINIVHTNKYKKKLQSPGALNIQETTGYKQKENVKK